jgi:hypothetical protein
MKIYLLAFVVALLALIGCRGNPLVGTWRGEFPPEAAQLGANPEATLTMNADNTFSMAMKMGPADISMSGTYTHEGQQVTLTPTGEQAALMGNQPLQGTLSEDNQTLTLGTGMMSLTFRKQ